MPWWLCSDTCEFDSDVHSMGYCVFAAVHMSRVEILPDGRRTRESPDMLYEESKIDISELEDFDINLDWKKGILFLCKTRSRCSLWSSLSIT